MTPLFVSYFANWKGEHRGWLVLDDVGPIKGGIDIVNLCARIEFVRGWPAEVVTIVSFQRLEPIPGDVGSPGKPL